MAHSAIERLYQRLTGRPWTTVRSATAEFGPPPGAVYRDQLAEFTDAQLLAADPRVLLAQLRAAREVPTGKELVR